MNTKNTNSIIIVDVNRKQEKLQIGIDTVISKNTYFQEHVPPPHVILQAVENQVGVINYALLVELLTTLNCSVAKLSYWFSSYYRLFSL